MIKAEIFDQKIRLNTESVASDSVKFLKIQFLLDENWDTAFKTAVFKNEELDISASVIMEEENEHYLGDNICIIPFEVIKPPCFSVSLSGIKGETVITTIPSEIKVYKSGDISADEPESYTPSQYEQLVGIYNETKSIAESVRRDADNGAFNGKNGEDGKDAVTEQSYNPESENAQSGKAVKEAVDGLNGVFAFAIKPKVNGKAIKVNDVSPTEHELKVKVVSNYFDVTKVMEQNDSNGVVVINANGTLSITPKNAKQYQILGKLTTLCPNLKGGDTIVLSYTGDCRYESLGLQYTDSLTIVVGNKLGSTEYISGYKTTITLPTDISNVYMYFSGDLTEHTVSNISITNEENGIVTVSRCGKNLISYPFTDTTKTESGITFTDNGDVTITVNGTATKTVDFILNDKFLVKKGMWISGIPKDGYSDSKSYEIQAYISSQYMLTTSSNYEKSNATEDFPNATQIKLRIRSGYSANNLRFKPQVEMGASKTEFEPYKELQTVTANAEGVVKGLTSISPNMTLIADKDVVLECEYIADTKLYIDNKIESLKKLM